jgi:hypothetical protein
MFLQNNLWQMLAFPNCKNISKKLVQQNSMVIFEDGLFKMDNFTQWWVVFGMDQGVCAKTLPSYTSWSTYMFRFMYITFILCFIIGKAHRCQTFPKCRARLGSHVVLGNLILGLPPTLGLFNPIQQLLACLGYPFSNKFQEKSFWPYLQKRAACMY